jgi:hypothetical protein
MSSATNPTPLAFALSQNNNSIDNNQKANDIPLLPAAADDAHHLPRIQLGETIQFAEMGPVIINTDGTTRRIDNWDQLTEKEREVTWRRISKRNEERRKKLLLKAIQDEPDVKKEL